MNTAGWDTSEKETSRIKAEYKRRDSQVPSGFYSWGNPGNFLMHGQVARTCIQLLQRRGCFPFRDEKILDVGCGWGTWLLEFLQWQASPRNLAGIDLVPDRLSLARERLPHADLRLGSAAELPWTSESFDFVTQFTVFTSVLDPAMKRQIATEMLRVLKPGGSVLWCDFRVNNPSNDQVRGIRREEIHSLFPECALTLRPTVLAPPVSRRLASWSWTLAEALHSIPFLCTHYIGLLTKAK